MEIAQVLEFSFAPHRFAQPANDNATPLPPTSWSEDEWSVVLGETRAAAHAANTFALHVAKLWHLGPLAQEMTIATMVRHGMPEAEAIELLAVRIEARRAKLAAGVR